MLGMGVATTGTAWSGYYPLAFSGRRLGIVSPQACFMLNTRSLNYRALSVSKLIGKVGVSKSQCEPQHGFQDSNSNRFSEVRSTLQVVGLDLQRAPLEVLERFFMSYSELSHAAGELSSLSYIEEAAVLRIFDRFEIYVSFHTGRLVLPKIISWMVMKSGVAERLLYNYCYILKGNRAARHLFEVAAGSYSLLSETQILAEMEEAIKYLKGVKSFGRAMSALFEHAIAFGKLMKSQTEMGDDSHSLAAAGVGLAATKLLTSESPIKALVVGAGMMGRTVIKHLVAEGFNTITVIDKTESPLAVLRNEVKGVKIIYKPFEEMVSCIKEADVVFACFESEKAIILEEHLNSMTASNSGGIKRIIDIALPRNVGDGVYKLPSVQVYNLRDIKRMVLAQNKDGREKREIMLSLDIDQHTFKLQSWMNSLAPSETLQLLACLERTRDSVLEKNLLEMGKSDVLLPQHVKHKHVLVYLSMELKDRIFRYIIESLIRHSGEENLAKAMDHIFGISDDQECHGSC